MDASLPSVSLDELRLFHGIDRSLYTILVRELCRNPSECIQIMALWLWLERGGFCDVINKILCLPSVLINELADEALACLMCVNDQFRFLAEGTEIPLTHTIVKKEISLQFFLDNRLLKSMEIKKLVKEVCFPALSDILESAMCNCFMGQNFFHSAGSNSSMMQYFSPMSIGGSSRVNEVSKHERTMFVTFSRGYPVGESEVKEFFGRIFGNCVESFHLQEVKPEEQPLYARVVFFRSSFVNKILNGVDKAKLTINGKHVWMRKFVPKSARLFH